MATTTEPPWLHKSSGVAPRNGTNSHTVNFTTDGTAPFTPATGSLLLFIVFGGVTHTEPGGTWTERLQPVNSGELSLFTKVAASDTSITITHNGSNYPTPWCVYEFPTGSTYTAGIGNDINSDVFPTLTGLPGTAQVIIAAKGRVSDNPAHVTAPDATWTAPFLEDSDTFAVDDGTTDGAWMTTGHAINITSTSVTPAATVTYSGQTAERENIVFAINATVAGGGTTPFTRDYGIVWRTLNSFTRDYSAQWRVLNTFARDVALQWRTLNTLTRDVGLVWRTLNNFNNDNALVWRTFNTFNADTSLQWRTLNSFNNDVALQWRTLNNFNQDNTLVWRTLNAFTKDTALQWRVLNSFSRDITLSWRTLNSFNADTSLLWRTYNTFNRDVTLMWDVMGGTSFVRDYGITWRTLNAFTNDVDLRWRTLNMFARDYAVQWRVMNVFQKDVLIQWRVRNSFTSDWTILWSVVNQSEFTLWNGATEEPLVLEGVWDGTQIVPVILDQVL